MKIPLFTGQTNESRSRDVDYQKTQNWYPSIEQTGRNGLVLYPTPGLTEFTTAGTGPIRGQLRYSSTALFVVSSDTLYEIGTGGAVTSRGTLNTASGNVQLAHNGPNNGTQIIIADGTNGYIWDSTYSTFYQIKQFSTGTTTGTTANKLVDSGATFVTDGVKAGVVVYNTTDSTQATVTAVDSETQLSVSADIFTSGEDYNVGSSSFPDGATHVQFMDGYFLCNDPSNDGRFYRSESYDGSDWVSTRFATAERNPDKLQSVHVNGRELWLLGEITSEVWYNSGTGVFSFSPMSNGYIETGCVAPFSVASHAGTMFWLSQDNAGDGQVVMSSGLQPQIISTSGISSKIQDFTTLSDAVGYIYQAYGHIFYVLTFPTEQATIVYDMTTGMWHEWSSATIIRHKSQNHVFFAGKNIVGDYNSGKLYYLDYSAYDDDGDTITRLRRSPHIHADGKRVFHKKLEIVIEGGVGTVAVPDPQIIMRYSDDGGHTWSSEQQRDMGASTGEYGKNPIWRRLGRSADRIYEIKVTDAVKAIIIDGYTEVSPSGRELAPNEP